MLNELGIADLSAFEAVLMHDTGAVLTKKEFDGTGRALALTQDEGKGIPYNSNKQLSHARFNNAGKNLSLSLSHTHTTQHKNSISHNTRHGLRTPCTNTVHHGSRLGISAIPARSKS